MARAMEKEGIAMLSDVSGWTAAARATYLWSSYRERIYDSFKPRVNHIQKLEGVMSRKVIIICAITGRILLFKNFFVALLKKI